MTATDPSGLTATINVTIKVTGVDEAPEITVGPATGLTVSGPASESYAENGTGPVATYTASGPDAALATWTLGGDDAGDFSISRSGVLTFASVPDFENPADADTDNVYMVTVEADDGTYMDTHEVTVTVTEMNEPPAIAGDAEDYPENGTGAVATFTATDPENAGAVTLAMGGADASLFDLSGVVLTFKASPNYEAPGDADGDNVYEVTVRATDSDGLTASTGVTITVTDVNEPPAITGDVEHDYAENGAGDVATFTANDPDAGAAITWEMSGADASLFDISGGVLTFVSPPDFEAPGDADGDNEYMVTVVATDSDGLTDSSDVSITVTDVNEPPAITGDAEHDYAENGAGEVATFTATDPENAGAVTLAMSGADTSLFDLSDGVLTFVSPPDYEAPGDADGDNVYEVTVVATDSGNITASINVTITVTDVNEPPAITGDAEHDYAENGAGDVATFTATDPDAGAAITWEMSGADASLFDISGGVLTFVSPPDYENPADADMDNVYEVTVSRPMTVPIRTLWT